MAAKLAERKDVEVIERTSEGFLAVRAKGGYEFAVAVLSVPVGRVIELPDVDPLFSGHNRPELVINVPSGTLWSGAAIDRVHAAFAAFGTLGDVARAGATGNAGTFRDKGIGFFITAMKQHSNVTGISYVYDSVLRAERRQGGPITVAVVGAYNMGAEDVRNARASVGRFDVIVKSSSYGGISAAAQAAALDMGAQALSFRELMKRLGS
ncbi:MAG: hypothetical protein GXC94_13320 [Comamonadaceae bacterium]|nr:hypothetical protein [Comamonadaceae bacterium]